MKVSNNYSEHLRHKVFDHIKTAAEKNEQDAFIIGGYVRDLILENAGKDLDIVTSGNGIALAQECAKLMDVKKIQIFKNFGTAMLKYRNWQVEFVGARKESYRKHSRNPIVSSGTLEEDRFRRDFTINAMSISLNPDSFGHFHDPFNGIRDLQNQIIRTPLDPLQTFSDDPLRMMRAIRFASQLSFQIERETLNGIRAMSERIRIVAPERISDELNKILLTEKPSLGLELLEKTGILNEILPELVDLKGVQEEDGKSHKENFYHTLEVVDNIRKETTDLWLVYAALFHDIGKAPTRRFDPKVGFTFHGHELKGSKMVPAIFRRLKLPLNESMRYVQKLIFLSSRPIALVSDDVSDSGVRRLLFDAGDHIDDLMTLCEADITSKNPERVRRYKQNFKRVRRKLEEIEEKDRIRNFQPPIDGTEIIKTFEIKEGKVIGNIKSAVKEAILDGKIANTQEEARRFMMKYAESKGIEIRRNE
jgi:tRNA nucleotidyltransferase/poly(A) polymerase